MKKQAIAAPAPAPPKEIQRRSVRAEPLTTEGMPGAGTSFVIWMASVADSFTPWGSNVYRRDQELRDWWHTESVLASAIYTVVASNSGFEWELEGPPETTKAVQRILESANMGKGWHYFIQKLSLDLYTQDNGAFFEIIRKANRPDAPIMGLTHLEALRCTRTGDWEHPVIYQDRRGNLHKMPYYSVVTLEEFPSPIETMHGVQYCAVTRVLRAAQIMRDMEIYRGEKVGGRFAEAIHVLGGVSKKTIDDVEARMQEDAANAGLARYINPLIVESLDPQTPPTHVQIDMKSLPENFNIDDELRWYIAMIALGLGRDYQEFAPLPRSNLGSGMQSEVLHLKTRGKGPKTFMDIIDYAMNEFVMPQTVEFNYQAEDVDLEGKSADVKLTRAQAREIRINSGELDPIIARQIAVDEGDLDPKYLELLGEQDLTPDMVLAQRERIESEMPDEKGIVRELVLKAWEEGSTVPLKKVFTENAFMMSINGKIESIQDQLTMMVLDSQKQKDHAEAVIANMELALEQFDKDKSEPQIIEVIPKKLTKELENRIKELGKVAAAHATSVNLGMGVIEQEVLKRDNAGRISVIRKTLESGEVLDYEVIERGLDNKIQKIRLIS